MQGVFGGLSVDFDTRAVVVAIGVAGWEGDGRGVLGGIRGQLGRAGDEQLGEGDRGLDLGPEGSKKETRQKTLVEYLGSRRGQNRWSYRWPCDCLSYGIRFFLRSKIHSCSGWAAGVIALTGLLPASALFLMWRNNKGLKKIRAKENEIIREAHQADSNIGAAEKGIEQTPLSRP